MHVRKFFKCCNLLLILYLHPFNVCDCMSCNMSSKCLLFLQTFFLHFSFSTRKKSYFLFTLQILLFYFLLSSLKQFSLSHFIYLSRYPLTENFSFMENHLHVCVSVRERDEFSTRAFLHLCACVLRLVTKGCSTV
jgi:hypothetical protein